MMNLRLLFIASNHIDIMCDNCKTAFDVQEGKDIICPECGKKIDRATRRRIEITTDRAIEMLNIAADYIREHWPEGTIEYDETTCDGYCVADDCDTAAEELKLLLN